MYDIWMEVVLSHTRFKAIERRRHPKQHIMTASHLVRESIRDLISFVNNLAADDDKYGITAIQQKSRI